MCSGGHPKFLAGSILWSPDGNLRLIGHVCATKDEHFGEALYRQLIRQREQEELDNVTLAWLEANIASLKPIAVSVAELRSVIDCWEEQQRKFFRDVAPLAGMLENIARREGGILTVMQESSTAKLVAAAMGGATAGSHHKTITIGVLSGLSFLHRPNSKRSRQLEGMLEAFERVPDGQPQE
jgi:hypothetical protein